MCARAHACHTYGVALVSGIDRIIGLFCKRALQKRRYSAKETYNFIDPTDHSHPIHRGWIALISSTFLTMALCILDNGALTWQRRYSCICCGGVTCVPSCHTYGWVMSSVWNMLHICNTRTDMLHILYEYALWWYNVCAMTHSRRLLHAMHT